MIALICSSTCGSSNSRRN